jgi:hypothetical protein
LRSIVILKGTFPSLKWESPRNVTNKNYEKICMAQLEDHHRYGVYLILETREIWSEVGNSSKLYCISDETQNAMVWRRV